MTALLSRLREASAELSAAGVESAEHDARALAVHAVGVARPVDLLMRDELTPAQEVAFAELVRRRALRVPLQHLVGSAGFRYLDLQVGPGVFVPRPETESLVQWVVEAVRGQGPVVVDLCTGSGAIALSLAHELLGATVHAVELDPAALVWTRRNAEARAALGDTPVHLHLGDAATALPELSGTVDVVVSNPPYVEDDGSYVPEPEVTDHDPAVAIWAGHDGLDVIRAVERSAHRLLRPGGLLAIEHSDRQGRSAPALLRAAGWLEVADHRDLAGRDRFVTAVRAGERS
jgi:release factor glutamine methyltransferase